MKNALTRMIVLSLVGVAALGVLSACSSTGETGTRDTIKEGYTFWPLAPDEPRIQFVKAFRSGLDLGGRGQSGFEDLVFGKQSESESAIKKPYGVDLHGGRIYVCDIRAPALTVLDVAEHQVRLVGVRGVNRLAHPVDVAVAVDGWIYVADNERRAVVVFNPEERYAATFAVQGWKPVSLAVHGDRLYVCDLEAQRVVILDRRSGSVIGEFGGAGDEDGRFRVPIGVDTDRDGYVYVSDMMRARMQKFTPDGDFLAGFGRLGDYAGAFARPKQIAVDRDGIIYVVDSSFNNVQMFNDEFQILMAFGAAGPHPGAMNLPVGVAVSDEGVELFSDLFHPGFEVKRLIAVTNQFGPQKVSLYALGRRKDGWSVAQLQNTSAASAGVGMNENLTPLQAAEGEAPGENAAPPEPEGGGGVD